MIKIKKGDSVLTVTRGAFNNYYKGLGYKVLRAPRTGESLGEVITHPEEDSHVSGDLSQLKITPDEGHDEPEDEEEDLDLSEIPLSEMTGQQLRQYAEQLGLKTEGLKKRELRELIRNHLK